MSHEYCKQHPRPMSSPVMAAIRVRQSRRWATCGKRTADMQQGKAEELLLIILRMKYGGADQPKIVPLPRPSLLCSIMTVSCLSASCLVSSAFIS